MKRDEFGHRVTEISDLYFFAQRFQLDDALIKIGVVGRKLMDDDALMTKVFQSPRRVNGFNLAFVSKALILNSNDYRYKLLDDPDLLHLADLFNNLEEKIYDLNADETTKRRQLFSFLVRTAYQQFPLFQTGLRHQIPRTLILFEDIPATLQNPKIDIAQAALDIYGLTLTEIINIGVGFFAQTDKGVVSKDYLTNSGISAFADIYTKEKVGLFIEKFSSNYQRLREIFREEDAREGLEKYSFNALRKYPVVSTDSGKLAIPVPVYLIDRLTSGIYYDLMDHFRQEDGNPFLEFFGKELFEHYAGMILEGNIPNSILLQEWMYDKNGNQKTSDWILIKGKSAILIECKTSGITKEAKTWADVQTLQDDLKKRVVGAIEQMIRLKDKARNFHPGLEALHSVEEYYFVPLTYDKIFLASSPPIKELIDDALRVDGYDIPYYEVLSIDDLEFIVPVLQYVDFDELLRVRHSGEDWASEGSFEMFVAHYLKRNGLPSMDRVNPLLEVKFDSLFLKLDAER